MSDENRLWADVALLAARVGTDGGNRTDLDAVLVRLGVSREELLDSER